MRIIWKEVQQTNVISKSFENVSTEPMRFRKLDEGLEVGKEMQQKSGNPSKF
jgi:hypothetical protein